LSREEWRRVQAPPGEESRAQPLRDLSRFWPDRPIEGRVRLSVWQDLTLTAAVVGMVL